jgi:hypothetical protein
MGGYDGGYGWRSGGPSQRGRPESRSGGGQSRSRYAEDFLPRGEGRVPRGAEGRFQRGEMPGRGYDRERFTYGSGGLYGRSMYGGGRYGGEYLGAWEPGGWSMQHGREHAGIRGRPDRRSRGQGPDTAPTG